MFIGTALILIHHVYTKLEPRVVKKHDRASSKNYLTILVKNKDCGQLQHL